MYKFYTDPIRASAATNEFRVSMWIPESLETGRLKAAECAKEALEASMLKATECAKESLEAGRLKSTECAMDSVPVTLVIGIEHFPPGPNVPERLKLPVIKEVIPLLSNLFLELKPIAKFTRVFFKNEYGPGFSRDEEFSEFKNGSEIIIHSGDPIVEDILNKTGLYPLSQGLADSDILSQSLSCLVSAIEMADFIPSLLDISLTGYPTHRSQVRSLSPTTRFSRPINTVVQLSIVGNSLHELKILHGLATKLTLVVWEIMMPISQIQSELELPKLRQLTLCKVTTDGAALTTLLSKAKNLENLRLIHTTLTSPWANFFDSLRTSNILSMEFQMVYFQTGAMKQCVSFSVEGDWIPTTKFPPIWLAVCKDSDQVSKFAEEMGTCWMKSIDHVLLDSLLKDPNEENIREWCTVAKGCWIDYTLESMRLENKGEHYFGYPHARC